MSVHESVKDCLDTECLCRPLYRGYVWREDHKKTCEQDVCGACFGGSEGAQILDLHFLHRHAFKVERANSSGTFLVTTSKSTYYYWPKSSKFREKGTKGIHRGKDVEGFVRLVEWLEKDPPVGPVRSAAEMLSLLNSNRKEE